MSRFESFQSTAQRQWQNIESQISEAEIILNEREAATRAEWKQAGNYLSGEAIPLIRGWIAELKVLPHSVSWRILRQKTRGLLSYYWAIYFHPVVRWVRLLHLRYRAVIVWLQLRRVLRWLRGWLGRMIRLMWRYFVKSIRKLLLWWAKTVRHFVMHTLLRRRL